MSYKMQTTAFVACLFAWWSLPSYSAEQSEYQLAPILFAGRLGGNVDYLYQNNTVGSSKNSSQTLGLNLLYQARGMTFFWQPWLARLEGGLEVGAGVSTHDSSQATRKSGKTALSGRLAMKILPSSRFPFVARVFRHDTKNSGYTSGYLTDTYDKGYAFDQKYRTRKNYFDGILTYQSTESGRTSIGPENRIYQWNFYGTLIPAPDQSLRITGTSSISDRPITLDHSTSDIVVLNHLYRPISTFSVASLANWLNSNYQYTQIGQPQQNRNFNVQQLSSFASWRPRELPITTTSSIRLLRTNNSSNGVLAPKVSNSNFNLGANYAWSKLLRIYGSAIIADDNITGTQTISTNASIAARKAIGERGDAMNLWGFRYTQYVSASLSNNSSTTNSPNKTTTSTAQSLGGNIGHALTKTSNFGSKGLLSTNLSQRLSTILSSNNTPFTNLYSTGSLNWSLPKGRGRTSMSFRINDSHTLSGNKPFFQLMNFQASRSENLSHYKTLTGNLTIQATRSGNKDTTTPFVARPNASLALYNSRLLGIRNMIFHSTIQVRGTSIVSSSPQGSSPLSDASSQSQQSYSWSNNIDYQIGRLRMEIRSIFAEISNTKQSSLLFHVIRSF